MVQIKHFVAFILAAATVIAPVAARPKRRGKSHQTVLTGTGQLNEFGNLKSAVIQVNGKLLDPIPVDMDNHNVSNGRFLMTAPFNYQMEPFGAQVLNRNETTMKAITLKESALGSKGTIFELQLKPFAGETTENAVHVVPREDNKMFVRFFDRDNAWLCRLVSLSVKELYIENFLVLEDMIISTWPGSFSKRIPLSVILSRWICVIGSMMKWNMFVVKS